MWWQSVGAEWIMQRLGVVWREDTDEAVESIKVKALLVEGDSTSEEGLQERAEILRAEYRMLPAANIWICDPPFGYQKHEGTDDAASKWDQEAWPGDELKRCLRAMKASGFLSEDSIGMIYHPPDRIGEYWAALSEEGFQHHQLVYFYKAGQERCDAVDSNVVICCHLLSSCVDHSNHNDRTHHPILCLPHSWPGAQFNHHKVQMATITFSGGKIHGNDRHLHWDFKSTGENRDRRMDPVTFCPSPDSTKEWHQPRRADYGTSARCTTPHPTGPRPVNRSQKPLQHSM